MLNHDRLPAGVAVLLSSAERGPSPLLPGGSAGSSAGFEHNGKPHDDPAHKNRSQGEIEAAVCEGMARFMQAFMGRGPKAIHSHLIADLVVIRVQGVLTAAEQHLFATLEPQKGRDLFKGLRTQLVETSRARLDAVIEAACELPAVSMHHDISTVTGEEVFLFRLTESPIMRPQRKK